MILYETAFSAFIYTHARYLIPCISFVFFSPSPTWPTEYFLSSSSNCCDSDSSSPIDWPCTSTYRRLVDWCRGIWVVCWWGWTGRKWAFFCLLVESRGCAGFCLARLLMMCLFGLGINIFVRFLLFVYVVGCGLLCVCFLYIVVVKCNDTKRNICKKIYTYGEIISTRYTNNQTKNNIIGLLFRFIKFFLNALVKELQLVLGDNKFCWWKPPWNVEPWTKKSTKKGKKYKNRAKKAIKNPKKANLLVEIELILNLFIGFGERGSFFKEAWLVFLR